MGIFDKASEITDKIDDVKALVEEHADKLPGGIGDKVVDMLDKVEAMADKLPGGGDDAPAEA